MWIFHCLSQQKCYNIKAKHHPVFKKRTSTRRISGLEVDGSQVWGQLLQKLPFVLRLYAMQAAGVDYMNSKDLLGMYGYKVH